MSLLRPPSVLHQLQLIAAASFTRARTMILPARLDTTAVVLVGKVRIKKYEEKKQPHWHL